MCNEIIKCKDCMYCLPKSGVKEIYRCMYSGDIIKLTDEKCTHFLSKEVCFECNHCVIENLWGRRKFVCKNKEARGYNTIRLVHETCDMFEFKKRHDNEKINKGRTQ